MKRTKILATIGPASESKEILVNMIKSGVNAVRCNFSHGTPADHCKRITMIREIAKELGVHVGILVDLQGPKIRISKFKDKNHVELAKGETFILDADLGVNEGNATSVGIDYKELPKDVKNGDILLLDDGKIVFVVIKVVGSKIFCSVVVGGVLSNNKGINKKGGGLTAPALTDKDKEDIKVAAKLKVDYVAVSFPRDGKDLDYARRLLSEAGWDAGIVSKVERVEAITNIDEIIKASDAVMVARGDLAVEVGDENVPAIQKMIIQRTRNMDKIAITATQMMESMIVNANPTRAEASDVANAVLDGTDVVMLSAESAAGKYPVETVAAMSKICEAAECNQWTKIASKDNIYHKYNRIDNAVAVSAIYLANIIDAKGIISLTESGSTPLWMSRINTNLPIYGLSRNEKTLGLMTLYRGVIPIYFDPTTMSKSNVSHEAALLLKNLGVINDIDSLILTSGDNMGIHGSTNTIKVIQSNNINN